MAAGEKINLVLIGSSCWDTLAIPAGRLFPKSDCPGTVVNRAGGVMLNVVRQIAKREKYNKDLLFFSSIGSDNEGKKIFEAIKNMGISTKNLTVEWGPSDRFVGIEDSKGLLYSAISDFSCTAKAEQKMASNLLSHKVILNKGIRKEILLDGNLSEETVLKLFHDPILSNESFNLISVSSLKSSKLNKIILSAKERNLNFCLYLNFGEAKSIADTNFKSVNEAASFLLELGLSQVVVTDGKNFGISANNYDGSNKFFEFKPQNLQISSTFGAGDVFAAEHFISKIYNKSSNDFFNLSKATIAVKEFLMKK